MYRTRMFLSSTRCGMDLEVFLSLGSRPSAVCGLDVLFAKTRFAGAKGICCRGAFDPCSPETPRGDGAVISEANPASYYQHCGNAHCRFRSALVPRNAFCSL